MIYRDFVIGDLRSFGFTCVCTFSRNRLNKRWYGDYIIAVYGQLEDLSGIFCISVWYFDFRFSILIPYENIDRLPNPINQKNVITTFIYLLSQPFLYGIKSIHLSRLEMTSIIIEKGYRSSNLKCKLSVERLASWVNHSSVNILKYVSHLSQKIWFDMSCKFSYA